jgi:hypothetical protein
MILGWDGGGWVDGWSDFMNLVGLNTVHTYDQLRSNGPCSAVLRHLQCQRTMVSLSYLTLHVPYRSKLMIK